MSNVYLSGDRRCFKVFVYGTLLKGWGNFQAFLSYFEPQVIEATVRGRIFWAGVKGCFPCLFNLSKGARDVHGQIMVIRPQSICEALRSLDRLEGYAGPGRRNHYDRVVKVAVDLKGRRHRVFTYSYPLNQLQSFVEQGLEISSGSWASAMRNFKEERRRSGENPTGHISNWL